MSCLAGTSRRSRTSSAPRKEICRSVADYVSMELFEDLLKDEEGHIDFLETQIDLLNSIGEQRYMLLQAEGADKADKIE